MAARKPDPMKKLNATLELFWKGKFAEAKEGFQEALTTAENPDISFTNRIKVYIDTCDAQLDKTAPEPKEPEEFYALGVEMLNNHQFETAIENLKKAVSKNGNNDVYVFTLALAYAAAKDADNALIELKKAIAIDPANTIYARNNSEFMLLAEGSEEIKSLLAEN